MLNINKILIWYFSISNKIYIFVLNTYLVDDILGEIYVSSKYCQNISISVSWCVCSVGWGGGEVIVWFVVVVVWLGVWSGLVVVSSWSDACVAWWCSGHVVIVWAGGHVVFAWWWCPSSKWWQKLLLTIWLPHCWQQWHGTLFLWEYGTKRDGWWVRTWDRDNEQQLMSSFIVCHIAESDVALLCVPVLICELRVVMWHFCTVLAVLGCAMLIVGCLPVMHRCWCWPLVTVMSKVGRCCGWWWWLRESGVVCWQCPNWASANTDVQFGHYQQTV